nr:DNA repair protein REV1 isoform X1 [Ipomoea batatas]GME07633.1 DNA repair protein REV1 isoform X1 [Ipomoea batatas]
MSFDSSRSANSGSKSKRSLSSNPTSSNTSSKRKKTSQKTLGMAWGANSRSSSRPAFSHSPFSDFGSYMAVKNRKLHQQFDAEASSSSYSGTSSSKESRPIFQGVSIFVDGYTVPSNQVSDEWFLC